MRNAAPALALLLSLAACAHGHAALYGHYVAYDEASQVVAPPVTLELARSNRYRFCQSGRCSTGRFTIQDPDDREGRIAFQGEALAAYSRAVYLAAVGPANDLYKGRKTQGSVEMSYTIGSLGAEITFGPGDSAFVKR